jgi:putative redox protein
MPEQTVHVEATMGDDWVIECRTGNLTVYIDQSREHGGRERGPEPMPYTLLGLAGCIGSIGRIISRQQRFHLRGMEITIEADLDSDYLMGRTTEGRAGFSVIRAIVDVDADMTREEKEAFLAEIDRRCPVTDVLERGTLVEFTVV